MMSKSSRAYTAPVPTMPPGLVELMEGLAKDVLRYNPTDIYTFCAKHMEKLLEIRDGTTPKRATLEQKIAKANKKIKERAEQRRQDYDIKMQAYVHSVNKSKDDKIKEIDKYSDAGQYIKDNIVKIPEKDLFGDVEHEIISKIEENHPSPESFKSVHDSLYPLKPDLNVINDVEDSSQIDKGVSVNDNDAVVNIKDGISEDETIDNVEHEKEMIPADSDTLDTRTKHEDTTVLELFTETENVAESQHVPRLIFNDDILESEKTHNNYDERNQYDMEINMQENENTFHSREEIINVLVTVGPNKDLNDSNVQTSNTNNITLYNAIDKICENKSDINNGLADSMSSDFYEVQNDATTEISTRFEKDGITKSKDGVFQSQVNNTSMDLETAAITIQKVFRSFLFRNKTLSTDDATNVDINLLIEDKQNKDDTDILSMNVNKDRRALGLSRIDTVLQTVNEEKSLSQSTDDSSTLSSAATIIQAHVRGFLVRNKINVNKNSSTTSGVDSDGLSFTSIEADNDNRKNKTILNIHIVPESGHFMSRDESVLTSIDLSLDGSPPSSTNLHPLGYDTSERRKQLKREDAIQSVSPPSNNSGKLSEEVDSVKEIIINNANNIKESVSSPMHELIDIELSTMVDNLDTALEVKSLGHIESPVKYLTERPQSMPEMTSDEMDVVTPFTPVEESLSSYSENHSNLIHSGEFHEVVLPTKVSRSDTSVVRGE